MTGRRSFVLLFGLLAAAAAVVFFAISIDHDVYAPGSSVIHQELTASGHGHGQTAWELRTVLRKVYSVVAFAIVGFFAAPLIARRRRVAVDALLVAGFSTIIEIGQKVAGAHESAPSNAFDIGCGALGGVIGAAALNGLVRFSRPRP